MTNLKSTIADEEMFKRMLEEVKLSSKLMILTLLILTQFNICSAQQKKSVFVIGDKISIES